MTNKFVAIANADPDFVQVAASFALEGIEVTEFNAEMSGRLIAGDITVEEGLALINAKHDASKKA